jgi:tryptophan synthase alpha chain
MTTPNRLQRTFDAARQSHRPVLATYTLIGDPDIETSIEIAVAAAESGAGLLELGVAFSDPIADGPTIAAAATRALARGVTLEATLRAAAAIRKRTDVPIVLMGYANPFFRFGVDRLCARAVEAGVDGFLIPDLPFDHAAELVQSAAARGLATPQLVAPTSSPERAAAIARAATGFVYFVAITGVTGQATPDPEPLRLALSALRARSPVPVIVGFGLRSPDQLRALRDDADGFVVGSALVAAAHAASGPVEAIDAVRALVRPLAAALR